MSAKYKRLSKCTVSVLLSILMLISSLTVGMPVNAVTTTPDEPTEEAVKTDTAQTESSGLKMGAREKVLPQASGASSVRIVGGGIAVSGSTPKSDWTTGISFTNVEGDYWFKDISYTGSSSFLINADSSWYQRKSSTENVITLNKLYSPAVATSSGNNIKFPSGNNTCRMRIDTANNKILAWIPIVDSSTATYYLRGTSFNITGNSTNTNDDYNWGTTPLNIPFTKNSASSYTLTVFIKNSARAKTCKVKQNML